MASWGEIFGEIAVLGQTDPVRKKYLTKLHELTGRNIIAYYSAWLSKGGENIQISINDHDLNGFMNALKDIDTSLGLDLILHTPGGEAGAAEAIVKYLKLKFDGDVRIIVPQIAMSAGTMIACSGNCIIMGKHSSLGPIDPQVNGLPAHNIKREFEEAKADLALNPKNTNYWAIRLQKSPVSYYQYASDAIDLSDMLVSEWLGSSMFDWQNPKDAAIIKNIVDQLNNHDLSKSHSRHFDIEFCKQIGLNIFQLEDDSALQEAVLSVHHAYMITCSNTNVLKIIENQIGSTWLQNAPISK